MLRYPRLAGFLIALTLTGAPAAHAHPHVWVTSSSELIYAPDGSVTGVRHAWTFDDMFSTYALQGIETKTKGVYTREDLAPLAQVNVDSLKEFAYFTYAKVGAKKEKLGEPADYFLEYKDSKLVLNFTLPLTVPAKTPELVLEIYDPSYFVNFVLAEKEPLKLVGAPAGCKLAVQKPAAAPPQQTMSEQNFLNGANANYGANFANRMTVACQ
ncbi:MAG: DUF1007 family protein [Pseudomonadota bacterium]|jgi:ABC-type uncharacterized transport system substrate-binding protein